jgi:hypothetical protein
MYVRVCMVYEWFGSAIPKGPLFRKATNGGLIMEGIDDSH